MVHTYTRSYQARGTWQGLTFARSRILHRGPRGELNVVCPKEPAQGQKINENGAVPCLR